MQLSYLHIFYAVARHGGFSKASRELKIQQPSISRAVKLLEDDLGQKLFTRFKRHLELTEAGKALLQMCERVFLDILETKKNLELKSSGPQGPMSFGVSDHCLNGPLIPVIEMFLKHHPAVVPRAFTGTSQDICQRLLTNELEFALLVTVPPEPALKMKATGTFQSKIYVHPKKLKDERVLSFFIGSREIDFSGSRSFPTLNHLKRTNPDVEIRFSCNNLETHKQLVLQGIGVAILPDFMMKEELKSKKVAVLDPSYSFETKLWLVTKQKHLVSAAAQAFIQAVEKGIHFR